MIGDYDDDTHFCLKCHATILGLDNYVEHRKIGCSKNLDEPLKSPLPSQILQQDEAFSSLKADDFFSSLELQSSSKKAPPPPTSGKTFSGILTRSKVTAVLQATTSKEEDQHSKSGKNAWIGGHQFKDLGSGDNQSKLIKAVDNLSRNTLKRDEPPPPSIRVYEESDEDSVEYDFDDETDDEEAPPRSYTGGKWKPTSPINWNRSAADISGWRSPPPNHTKGKWKPISPVSAIKEEYVAPPPSFTGSKWTQSKSMPSTSYNVPPPTHTKGKWRPLDYGQECEDVDDTEYPPPEYTKGKWKPGNRPDGESNKIADKNATPQLQFKKKSSSSAPLLMKSSCPPPSHTKGKWKPQSPVEEKRPLTKSTKQHSPMTKARSPVQYFCAPCNRRLASKVVYERHLKSELHLKRSIHNTEFEDTEETTPRLAIESSTIAADVKNELLDSVGLLGKKKRKREKLYIRCEVCRSRVNRKMLGKHLISHYHCRKGDITLPQAQKMVLENIHDIILQSPFQCAACKFYCNTQDEFLSHWKSKFHLEKTSKGNGFFLCTFCNYQASDNNEMFAHLTSREHEEVIAVINRSVPIEIKRIVIIECETCNEKFSLNIQLRKHCEEVGHVFTGRKINEHSCKLCDKYFRSSVSLAIHQRRKHRKKLYVCGLCSVKFDKREDIVKHRKSSAHRHAFLKRKRQEMGIEEPPKKCDYCSEMLSGFLGMKKHLSEKHPEHNVSCPTCGKAFTVPQDLTVHVRTKACVFNAESPKLEFSCKKCPFGTNSKSEQLFHEALHTEPLFQLPDEEQGQSSKKKPIPQYKCPVCSKLFAKASLRCHLRVHTSERPYVCSICNMGFVRKNNWMLHLKNHATREIKREEKEKNKVAQGERPFLCSTCGASFKRRFVLQQHMITHTGKQCRCPKLGCFYVARTLSALRDHFRIHCDFRNFACNICDYKGKSKQQLVRHQTVHETTRKFECTLCSFTARFSGHLKRHMRTHTGAKPFACPHCSYRSNNLENLRKHVISTNKHPGKYLYECKFCENEDERFKCNFAKDFKGHLIHKHKDRFQTGTAAASYISGIYEVQNDSVITAKKVVVGGERSESEEEDDPIEVNQQTPVTSSHDPIITYTTSEVAGPSTVLLTSVSKQDNRPQEELFPMFVIAKDEVVEMGSSTEAWNMVGSYDVESGVLIPFQTDEESLFEEHFT